MEPARKRISFDYKVISYFFLSFRFKLYMMRFRVRYLEWKQFFEQGLIALRKITADHIKLDILYTDYDKMNFTTKKMWNIIYI